MKSWIATINAIKSVRAEERKKQKGILPRLSRMMKKAPRLSELNAGAIAGAGAGAGVGGGDGMRSQSDMTVGVGGVDIGGRKAGGLSTRSSLLPATPALDSGGGGGGGGGRGAEALGGGGISSIGNRSQNHSAMMRADSTLGASAVQEVAKRLAAGNSNDGQLGAIGEGQGQAGGSAGAGAGGGSMMAQAQAKAAADKEKNKSKKAKVPYVRPTAKLTAGGIRWD
jgi:hypothetical protein